MLTGHHRGAVASPDTDLDPLQHSSPGPGQSRKEERKNPPRIPNGFLCAYLLFCVLLLQLLSQGSADVTILQAEVAWE
jgi:hypothetical protein